MARNLAPTDLHSLRVLAVARSLTVSLRSAYSLSLASLSYLFACSALLDGDKSGTFTHSDAARLAGLDERTGWQTVKRLAKADYLLRVGGQQWYKAQRWSLSPSGWHLAKDAAGRVSGLLAPLSVDKDE